MIRVRVGLLSLVLVIAALGPGGVAQMAGQTVSSEAAVSVELLDPVIDFPEGITFGVRAEADESITRAELRYQVEGDETLLLSIAEIEPDKTIDIEHFVDLIVNYLPPGVEISYFWRFATESGDYIDSDLDRVVWFDDRFSWKDYSGVDVTIYSYSGDDDFNRQVLQTAQETTDHLQEFLGVDEVRHFAFWLYESQSDFAGALAPNSQEWIGGITMPAYPTILATLSAGDDYGAGRMISHEVAHQILFQAVDNPFSYLSNWLDEGIATSEQQTGTDGMHREVQQALAEDRLPTVQSLTSEWPTDPKDVSLSYASSFSLVQFLLATYGDEGLAAIISNYAQGMSHDEALMNAIGLNTQTLNEAWREWIVTREN